MANPGGRTESRAERTTRFVLLSIGGTLLGLLVLAAGISVLALAAGEIVAHRANPVLKEKVIEALSARLDSNVQLDSFHTEFFPFVRVTGAGLRIYSRAQQSQYPLIAVSDFTFSAPWRELLQTPMHIDRVSVSGLVIHLPPKGTRTGLPVHQQQYDEIKIFIREVDSDNATLIIENGKPGKIPLTFQIGALHLTSAGAGQAMNFQATLVNPKPIGDISASGSLGPFQAESPGDTSVRGQYSFSNADLSTLKGIGGTLSSQGSFEGTLYNIAVDGAVSVPDFSLDVAGHPVPLNAKFQATVDGMNGDTYLHPVDARLLGSRIVASGDVTVLAPGLPGHDIDLDVTVGPAQIQDMLALAQKTGPPLMSGDFRMHGKLHIPPDSATVLDRFEVQGSFEVMYAHFTDEKLQSEVDQLSLRGLGEARQATEESQAERQGGGVDAGANTAFTLEGDFSFSEGKISLRNFLLEAPGAEVALNGTYTLEGEQLDFKGNARLHAKLTQMVTGWKSILLKPLNPIFSKGGNGTVIPIIVTGTRSKPHFGLDLHH